MFDADAFCSLAQIARHLALKAVPSLPLPLSVARRPKKRSTSLLPKLLMAWWSNADTAAQAWLARGRSVSGILALARIE